MLVNKLEGIEVNSEKLAAYVKPERENQQGVTKLIRELTDKLHQEMRQQNQHVDAQLNGLV